LNYAVNLCNVDKYTCFSLSNKGFIGFLKGSPDLDTNSPQFMKDLLGKINNTILNDLTESIFREDRNSMRDERKRPWSFVKTRVPFYGRANFASNASSLKATLKVTEKIVKKLGPPWKISERGRPPDYCPNKLASASLAKHHFPDSFETLKAKLEDIGFDCRINPRKKKVPPVPSTSELHWALQKIPEEYLEEGVRLLDEWCADSHEELFGIDGLNKFGVDGTESTCIELEELFSGFRWQLKRQTHKINGLVRLVTNTFCELDSGKSVNQKDLAGLLKKRKKTKRSIKGLEIYADPAYDAENNYEITAKNDSTLIVKPTKYTKEKPSGFYRKKGCQDYSPLKYKIRKTVERPFGNAYCRNGNKLHYRREDMRRKGELLRYIAHNIKAYLRKQAWDTVFKKITKQTKKSQVVKM